MELLDLPGPLTISLMKIRICS